MAKKDKVVVEEKPVVTDEIEIRLKKLEEREKAVEEKEAALNSNVEKATGKSVPMIWLGKVVAPGETQSCFGLVGVGNDDGFLVVDCPEHRVKNEMARKPKGLVPLKLYENKKKAQADFEAEFSID